MTTVGIVTGAGRGMGKACAAALSDAVDALLVVDLDAEAAATTAKELAGRRALVEPFTADVRPGQLRQRHRPARRRRPGRRAPLPLIHGCRLREGDKMAKGIMLVQSGPSDPAREDEYNDWYANTHIPQICAVPGITGARRYRR